MMKDFSHKHRTVDDNNRSIYLSKPIIAALVVGTLTIASRLGEICTTGWLAGWLDRYDEISNAILSTRDNE